MSKKPIISEVMLEAIRNGLVKLPQYHFMQPLVPKDRMLSPRELEQMAGMLGNAIQRLQNLLAGGGEMLPEKPGRAPGETMQTGSVNQPLPPKEKYWLVVPCPYNSKRWSKDEGNTYNGEIFRIQSCCKGHAFQEMEEKCPDIHIVAIFESTQKNIDDVPVMYKIVDA